MSLLRPICTGLAAGSYGTEMEGAALAAGVHGFPVVLTSFVGRGQAVREVAGLLETYRLVTVTGRGGQDPAGRRGGPAGGGPVRGRRMAGRTGPGSGSSAGCGGGCGGAGGAGAASGVRGGRG